MKQTEIVQADAVSMSTGDGQIEYMYQIIINNQETPAISLDSLRRLRNLCDCLIRFGEDYEKSK